MININPFSELTEIIPAATMQAYVIVMLLLVVGGTIIDVIHKRSKKYFDAYTASMAKKATRQLSGGEKNSLLVKTVTNEVLTSSEFKNPKRRLSHLLSMYGFILFVLSSAVMIFAYAGQQSAGIWPLLWHLGAVSLCVGGYWFWFDIRVDLASEGKRWYKVDWREDVFILSMLAMCSFALIWSFTGSLLMFALFLLSSTVLFSTVLWSKFAHMFFKPAAAYQKKVIWADGSRENLPDVPDLTDPSVQARFPDIPTYMGENPPYMGLGIKREPPRHY